MKQISCPWCNYTPKEGDKPMIHIKRINLKAIIQRGWKCPECGQSFKTEESVIAEPFYKKEKPKFLGGTK